MNCRYQLPTAVRTPSNGCSIGIRDASEAIKRVAWKDSYQEGSGTSGADQRAVDCMCGRPARYQELRSKPILTAVGSVHISRPHYWCGHCHTGQFPTDVEMDIADTESSPGVRRMQALVGQEVPFDHGRQQMKLLADLEVTAKAVERAAEAIGSDIGRQEQREIGKAIQLDLPVVIAQPVPILYVQMDGTGIPVVKKETVGRPGKIDGQPAHTREAKLGCVFTQTTCDKEGYPIRDPNSTTYTGAIETAEEFGKRLYLEAWNRGCRNGKLQECGQGGGSRPMHGRAHRHFDSLQIKPPGFAAAREDCTHELLYFPRDFLVDRFGRFFSSAERVSSAGRTRQIRAFTSIKARLSSR